MSAKIGSSGIGMDRAAIMTLFRHPLARAAAIHLGLLGGGWAVAAGIASVLGLGVSLLGILLGYGVVNIGLTAWLLRRRPALDAEPDETADALAAFADEPLGGLIAGALARLVKARRGVGRQSPMYRTLDRLVRTTRKIERRLALDADLRPAFARSLGQDLPLIAETAEQYVGVQGGDGLAEIQTARMDVAEGVLREAADRLDRLLEGDGKIDAANIGLIRMDAHAEVLAERLSADPGEAAQKAAAARVAHTLRRAARTVDDSVLTSDLKRVAGEIDALDGPGLRQFLNRDAEALTKAAEALLAEPGPERTAALRAQMQSAPA